MSVSRKIFISVIFIAVAFVLLGTLKWVAWGPARNMERTARAMIGRPEADLVKALGQPHYVVSSDTLAGRTVDYPWKGMNFIPVPNRPVRNKVLLYSWSNVAFYVYVDESGIIEYVAVAGT